MKKGIVFLSIGAAAAAFGLTPLASGHATVSLLQPQGRALTASSVTVALRVPTERATVSTFQVAMNVPAEVQQSLSVKSMADWKIVLKRRDTGQKNSRGEAIMATEKVTWIAKTAEARIDPGFYGEFYFRMRNPSSPQRLCFSIDQWYNKATKTAKPEKVSWSGPSDSATPASCLDVVAS
jgi:uncharacterized protein YcnI